MDQIKIDQTDCTLPKPLRLLAHVSGTASLIYLFLFLLLHTRVSYALHLSTQMSLIMDAGLSLLFFCQHSIMVRSFFKQRLSEVIPEHWFAAVFSISSGVALGIVVFFWQDSGPQWFALPIWWKSISGLCVVLVLLGFHWGSCSLPGFDPFGVKPRRTAQNKKMSLKIVGPYRFVRHPLYFFVLVLIWCTTIPTTDRIVFNLLWTGWIFLGTWLEEKDLVVSFGKDYHIYQKKVPMLIPFIFRQIFQPRNKETI